MADPLYGFCKTKFWDLNKTWYTDTPDFTECFQNTLLVWVPFGILLLGLPFEIHEQKKPGRGHISWNFYNITKLFFMVVLFGLTLTEFIWILTYNTAEELSADVMSSPAIRFVGYIIVTVMVLCGRSNGLQSSFVLFYYWFFHLIESSIVSYSKILSLINMPELEDTTILGLSVAILTVVFLQFILILIPDQVPNKMEYTIKENICPEERSSYISQLMFSWLDKLIFQGYKTPIKQGELWNLAPSKRAHNIVKDFDDHWLKEKREAEASGWDVTNKESCEEEGVYQPSLVFALIRSHWPTLLMAALQKTICDFLSFVSPLMLSSIISFTSSNEPLWKGVFYSFVIFGANELQSILLSQYFIRMYNIGMKVRVSIISAVYRKALSLSNKERQQSTVGGIVNLMSIDTQRFVDVMPFIIMLYSAPLQIVLSLYFLSKELGISVLGGVTVMLLMAPINIILANITKKLQAKDMKLKDERTKVLNEILNGIKLLKLYAWELPFGKMVQKIRSKEVAVLKTMAYYRATVTFLWNSAPFLVALASFTMFVLIDNENVLTANVAFVSLSLFNLLRYPLDQLPNLITNLIQVLVSVKRLNKFLRGEELDKTDVTHYRLGNDAIVVENGTFAWGSDHEKATLSNVNLKVSTGKLVAVVGQVGSGKSSLVSAILGELNKRKGKINVQGSVAYVPQQAWILNASVKDNILMYKHYNNQLYNKVLDVCALKPDLEVLPAGDNTEIGEKGINLSGGQKQRVSVARAVYYDSDVYFLDDPLSAVDSHVGKHIFDNVIGPSGVLKSKTRLFVTNSIAYLPQCDSIVVLKDGCISEMGTYDELLSGTGAFSDFLTQYLTQKGQDLEAEDLEQLDEIITKVPVSPEIHRQISKNLPDSEIKIVDSKPTDRLIKEKQKHSSYGTSEQITASGQSDKRKLIQDERMETAEVKIGVYLTYLNAIGPFIGSLICFFWFLSQAASVGGGVWLSEWSNDRMLSNGTVDADLRDLRLGVYGALVMAQGLGIMVGAFGLAYGSMKAADNLHNRMLGSILRSPMLFFDTTPVGRIINRFSKDTNTMDVDLAMNFRAWLITFLQVLSVVLVNSIETPLILVVLVPFAIIYYLIQKIYIASSRQLKRLEAVTKSPTYMHFSESITGASSIRAYGIQNIFTDEMHKRVDENMICYYPTINANRWLTIRLELMGNLIIFFASLFAVLNGDLLSPGSVGLSVSYAMSITTSLNCMVRMSSNLETNIVAVERIDEYSNLEPEKLFKIFVITIELRYFYKFLFIAMKFGHTHQHNPEAEWNNNRLYGNLSWPESGKINFNSYKTKYRPNLNLVLKGIDCDIQSGEKVGICGRTGAGKSSLTLGLFRLIEAQGGSITIDGIDISKLGLHDLRSRLTILPQDPVLFSGNLRENLDPFKIKTDEEIWSALEHAHLKNFVSGLDEGLEHTVAEGGENFSVGQRQLFCLARALLRKTKILVLDEATAAIDLETDDLIQMTIKKEFSNCTILTIAHRLNTIMDSSRVLVLDQGCVAEFDSPSNLLENKNSVFYGMAHGAGLI